MRCGASKRDSLCWGKSENKGALDRQGRHLLVLPKTVHGHPSWSNSTRCSTLHSPSIQHSQMLSNCVCKSGNLKHFAKIFVSSVLQRKQIVTVMGNRRRPPIFSLIPLVSDFWNLIRCTVSKANLGWKQARNSYTH